MTAETGAGVIGAAGEVCFCAWGGVGEVEGGGVGELPSRSVTRRFTSSLSLAKGSGDLARDGLPPLVSSCECEREE